MSVGWPIEVHEHAGVDAEVLAGLQGLGQPVEAVSRDREEYLIHDYVCEVHVDDVGAVRAGDDADDAGWFTPEEVRALDTSPGLVDALTEWGVLPSEG